MKRRIPIAAVSAALLVGTFSSAPGHAGSGSASYVRTQSVKPQQLEVASNGSSYTQVGPFGNIVADVRVGIKTGGWIDSWTTWLRIGAEEQDDDYETAWIDFSGYSFDQSYPQGHKPSEVDRTVQVIVPATAYWPMAVSHCNAMAARLRGQGLSDKQIFAQDRTIELGVRAELQYDSNPFGFVFDSYGNSDSEVDWPAVEKFDLVCKKWKGSVAPQAGDQLDSVPLVEKATLIVLEQAGPMAGRCKIRLSGVIETSAPDVEVSFRYRDKKGNESQVFDVTTDHTKTVMFSHDYDVPIDAQGPETGQVRIVGVSRPFKSAWADYAMDCTGPSFQALMPPTVELDVVPVDKIKVGEQVCYSKVKLYAKVTAQNAAMSGQGLFIGDYYVSKLQAYDIEAGETTLLGGERELDWTPDPQSFEAAAPNGPEPIKKQTIYIGFTLTNATDTVVVQVPRKPYTIKCHGVVRNPEAVRATEGRDDLTATPRPQPAPGGAPRLRLAPPAAEPSGAAAPRRLQLQPRATGEPPAPVRRLQRLRLKQQ